MALSSDNDGFLVGPQMGIDKSSYAKHLMILKAIRDDGADVRDDISSIRKTLAGAAKPALSSSAKVSRIPALAPVSLTKRATGDSKIPAAVPSENLAQPRKRVRASNDSDRSADVADRKDRAEAASSLKSAAMDLKGSAGSMLSGTETLDPRIAAAKEVKDMASPVLGMLKPIAGIFRRKGASEAEATAKISVPWYRRLWGELRDINKKSGGSGGKGGMFSGLLGGLAKIPLLGMLAKGAGGMLGGLLKGGGRLLGGAGGMLGKLGKGLFKRIPILGALFAGGSALASIFGKDDPNKSAAENRKDRFTGGGSGIGALLGGAIGMLGGPLGAIAGAALGDMVGGKIGEWMSEVNWDDVGKTITDTWAKTSDWVKSSFGTAIDFVKESWGKIADLGTSAFKAVGDWVSEKTGKVKELAVGAATAVKGAANSAYDKGAEIGKSGINAAKNLANTVTGGLYKGGSNANKAALIEAMNGAGIKDPKEQAMFMAQMDHESGGFKSYEENLNYSAAGLRKTFGKYYATDAEAEADARNPAAIANKVYGGRMGNKDPGDGYKYRGRGAIGLTGKDNYSAASRDLGLDLLNNPDLAADPAVAAKIATWYWKKNNLGAAGKAGDVTTATKKINGGLNGLDDRKAKYSQYLAQTTDGGLNVQTANDSKAIPPVGVTRAIAAASVPTIPPMLRPISASVPPSSYAATAPDLTKYAPSPTPPLKIPVASSSKGGQSSSPPPMPLTQNVADRNIAAVATGGIGGGSLRN